MKPAMPATAYLSLGSNVGDRLNNLQQAIARLRALGNVVKTSSFYETEPVELADQEWFVNCVVEFETGLSARELIEGILQIEREMGRQRNLSKGPRNIDLDVILYGNQVIDEPGLQVPHAAMHQRRFVLEPLVEVAPDAFHPVFMRSASELLKSLPKRQGTVKRLSGK